MGANAIAIRPSNMDADSLKIQSIAFPDARGDNHVVPVREKFFSHNCG
jgi:hypothetical protein